MKSHEFNPYHRPYQKGMVSQNDDASGWGDNLGSIRGLDTLLEVRLARLPDLAEPGPLVNFIVSSVFKRKNDYMTKYGTKNVYFKYFTFNENTLSHIHTHTKHKNFDFIQT